MGVVTADFLRQKRRYAILLIFIIAAFLTAGCDQPVPDGRSPHGPLRNQHPHRKGRRKEKKEAEEA